MVKLIIILLTVLTIVQIYLLYLGFQRLSEGNLNGGIFLVLVNSLGIGMNINTFINALND